MKKILLVPAAIFPYTYCAMLAYYYLGDRTEGNVVLKILAWLCLACLGLAFICNLVYAVLSRGDAPEGLRRTAFIIKLIHLPTYLVIFALSLLLLPMIIMSFPILFVLFLIDCVTLFFSAMISVPALYKSGMAEGKLPIFTIIFQFVFCLDFISLLRYNLKQKRFGH